MGLDLSITPIEKHNQESYWWLGNNRLRFHRCPELFALFGGYGDNLDDLDNNIIIKTYLLPNKVKYEYYFDNGSRATKKDARGIPLMYAKSGDMAKAAKTVTNKELGKWNEAIIAFLERLDPETPVVLYWH